MADLDLTGFLKESATSDLEWLDVDEKEYRALDRLPKQNLDVRPDLEALWARNDEPATAYLVPNVVPVPNPGIDDPKTMGDMSAAHGSLRTQADDVSDRTRYYETRRYARLALMKTDDVARLREDLVSH